VPSGGDQTVNRRASSVLMIFEDAHWSDPTRLEAFGCRVDQIASLPVLLIVTFRPEFEAPWIGRPHVTALALSRLAHWYRDVLSRSFLCNLFL
jgi:predicted ATPase